MLQEGATGKIRVKAAGEPLPSFLWLFNNQPISDATQTTLTIPSVTRADEGTYIVVASNMAGQATSAPIAAVVSNVDPERFVGLRWPGREGSGLTLESTDRLTPGAAWHSLSNYPPAATDQRFLEFAPAAAGFYRLSGYGSPAMFTGAGWVNGWSFEAPTGSQYRVDYTAASTGWTNWLILTNLVLPTSPYLFLDYESLGEARRVYRTTPVP